ncbi:hypothetical protein [Spirosoma sp.]|uniref:hypothetical protein n=1 Tax=Spirosoma sp. TaxID=1899569 RepID=UPI00262C4DFC|nr:hypothetical protein [Spirosoma sp.]MCX6215315.1 hypothetical protein [Spirosoma sp.]
MILACARWILPLSVVLLTFLGEPVKCQTIVERKGFAVRGGLSGGFDVGAGVGGNTVNPNLTYYELKSLTRSNTVLVGWTARLSAFYGQNLSYYTAPARLTHVDAIDTVSFSRLAQTSLNLGVRAEWNLGRLQLGASVDLLGFTFLGRSRIGQVSSSTGLFIQTDSLGQSQQSPFQGPAIFQQASPTRLNVKLWGDHERGMLTTEVYARIYLGSTVALKLGYQWLSTEMTLKNRDLVADNARFRNRVSLPYLALTFPITPW